MKKFIVAVLLLVCILFPDFVSQFAQLIPMWVSLPVFGGVVCYGLWREGVL